MDVRLEHPEWLWAALIAVPCVVVGWRWLGAMSPARRASALVARLALTALLACILARPTAVRRTNTLAVVAVVDVSDSVRRFAAPPGVLDRVRESLARASSERGPEDLIGIVAFDANAVTIATPTVGDISGRSLDVRSAEGSNLAGAIALGAAMIPPDAGGRLLLISDGVQTAGDAATAARQLARTSATGVRRGVSIDTVPIDYDVTNEVLIESVDAPPRATSEGTVRVRITLLATTPTSGTLRLLHNDQPVDANGPEPGAARRIDLKPGRNVEVVDTPLGPERVHRFRAIFEPDSQAGTGDDHSALRAAPLGDTILDNNQGEAFTITPGRGRVLIADGLGDGNPRGPGTTLADTLRESGLDAELRSPASLPEDLLALQEYDLVVLQNVPAEAVNERAQHALAAYVRDLGGGLVMTGGRDSFGAGGWRGTVLEPLLPVTLDLPEKLVVPEAATIFVIDHSGSMGFGVMGSGRSQQEIANEAVAVAIRSLDKNDLVGVVGFTNDAETIVEFDKNRDPAASAELVRSISPGGGTNMRPGLVLARQAMARVQAKTKQVIVLSDGRSQGENELPGFAAEMAAEGIKVSTIAIGDAARLDSMRQIADRGGGVYYQVIDPQVLPRVFLKAVRVVRSPMIREKPFTPVIVQSTSPLLAGVPDLPALRGLTLTQARAEPTITLALRTPEGEPVLAHWSVELGQVAAFTSDAGGPEGGWAADWLASPAYRQFWVHAVRTLSRAGLNRNLTARVEPDADRLHVSLEARSEDGRTLDRLTVPVTVFGPSGETINASLSQTQPGIYEATIPAGKPGSWIAVLKPADGVKRLPPVLAGASITTGAETRTLKSNRRLLEQIAASTGGRVLTLDALTPQVLFDRAGTPPHEAATPLWRDLLLWALVALLVDIGTRRIAWDRWVSREYGVELKRDAAESVRDRGREAQATLGGLREHARREGGHVAPAPSTFSDQDAEDLARAAADRRRAQRLAALRDLSEPTLSTDSASSAPETSSPTTTTNSTDAPAARGLGAAKQRARARFERDEGGSSR